MALFEELLETQYSTQTLIQRILTNFNKLPKARKTATALRSRIENLMVYWENCQQQHAKLCALADEDRRTLHEYFIKDKFLLISDTVEEIMDTFSDCLERLQPSNLQLGSDDSTSSHETRVCTVHLPRIDILGRNNEMGEFPRHFRIFSLFSKWLSKCTKVALP